MPFKTTQEAKAWIIKAYGRDTCCHCEQPFVSDDPHNWSICVRGKSDDGSSIVLCKVCDEKVGYPMMESVDQRLERIERRVAALEDFAIAYQQHSHAWTPPPTYGPLPTSPGAEWNISALTKFLQEEDQTDD